MILETLKIFLTQAGPLTPIYLILSKILGAILLFPGAPLTLLSGSLLGNFWGSIVAIIGNTLGAGAAFLIARYLFKDYIQKKFLPKYPKISEYEKKFLENGLSTVIFLRLVPLFPFNILNYLLGITKVSFKDYILGTFVGIIPGTIAFVYLGESLKMFSWINVGLALLAIIGLSYIGKFWKI
jgi:uncharacterized membrane protein YdjX (TVP38/TMEM64 family)